MLRFGNLPHVSPPKEVDSVIKEENDDLWGRLRIF
jgi:hypothetical protein